MNLGSNGKHDNHYTKKNDQESVNYALVKSACKAGLKTGKFMKAYCVSCC
jgi:hypothetical protein